MTTRKTYRDILTPSQAEKMHDFLCALSWAGGIAVEAGVKPNVKLFMKAWRGLPTTDEGKLERKRDIARRFYWAKKGVN